MTNNLTTTDALKRLAFANPVWRTTIGDGFSTGEYFADVTDTNTKSIVLKNPSDTHYFGVYSIKVRTSAEGKIGKAYNVTEDTQGAEPTTGVTNKRSSKDGTVADVRIGGDGETGVYSGGTSFSDKGVGAGSGDGGGATPGSTGDGGYSNVIAPGDNMLLSVQNTSGGPMNYISIDIDWAEIPAGTFPA